MVKWRIIHFISSPIYYYYNIILFNEHRFQNHQIVLIFIYLNDANYIID